MNRVSSELRQESLDKLRELLPPGTIVHCVLRHTSRSGMCRWIDLYKLEDQDRTYLSGYAWNIGIGEGAHPADQSRGGLRIGGCGMDMGFALVYDLSRKLYPDGFDCIDETPTTDPETGKRGWRGRGACPSNDHSNHVDRQHHPDGGYALRQDWI